MQPQINLETEPQVELQPDQLINQQVTPRSMPQPQSSSQLLFKILPIAGFALAVISLIISIISLSSSNQPQSSIVMDSETIENTTTAGTFEGKTIRINCNLPKNASDIVYLYLNYNYGKTGIFVSPDEAIEIFTKETTATGNTITTSKNLKTDTSDIFKQLLSDGIENFSNYEYTNDTEASTPENDIDWNWLAQIDNSDSSSCEAKGNDTPPAWFTKLTNLINDKFNQ